MNNYGTVFPETANTSTWNVFACSAPQQDASGNALLEASRTFCRGNPFPVPPVYQ